MKNKKYLVLALFISTLLLSACGGGGGGSNDPGTNPNPSDPASDVITLSFPGSLPYSDSITLEDSSSSLSKSYWITGLTQGQEYSLSVGQNDEADFTVYQLSDFTSYLSGCSRVSTCTVLPDRYGNVYLKVYYSSYTTLTTNYTLSMTAVPSFEGSPTSPVVVDSSTLPLTSSEQVGLSGYYQITGLTPGNAYRVTATLATGAAASLYVYQEQFESQACSSLGYYFTTGNEEYCDFRAAGSSIWVRVKGVVDGEFTLSISSSPFAYSYVSEGAIGSEVELTADVYYSSRETGYEGSYYHVAGLVPGETYRAFLSWIEGGNADLYVYSDPAYSTLLCSSTKLDSDEEMCLADASASGELWVKVDGSLAHQYLGASYSMGVYRYYPNEGTSSEPVQLSYSGSSPLYSGTVDTYSYYQVNGLAPGQSYVVDFTNIVNGLTYYKVGACGGELYSEQTSLTCVAEATENGTLSVSVQERYLSGDFTGSSFDLAVSLSAHQSEGDATAPISLALGSTQLPYTGSIGGADNFYVITGLTIDEAYTVTLDGTPSHPLTVYTDSFTTSVCNKPYPDQGSITQCTVRALSDSLWVKVGHSIEGGSFTLDAIHSPYQSEGSQAIPLAIALSTDPKQGVTRQSTVSIDRSYYQITGLTVGETYMVAIRNINSEYNHAMYIYDNAAVLGSTTYGDYICYNLNISNYWGDAYCAVTATDTSLWLMLKGNSEAAGASFDLSARLQPVSEVITVDYTAFPRTGSVDTSTTSIYTVTGLAANELYDITLASATDSVYLQSCVEPCVKQADSSGVMTITVSGTDSLYGAFYTLGISAGNVNEGTSGAPKLIDTTVTTLPYSGQVGSGTSYYTLSGLSADTMYEVSLTEPTANVELYVHKDSAFSNYQCSDISATTGNRLCGGISSATGELYISVPVRSPALGANYNLNVVQGRSREGSQGAEIQLAYQTAELPHAGSVDLSYSYYEITGLSGGNDYYIVLNNRTDTSANFMVFQDSAYSVWTCDGYLECLATTKNGSTSLYVRVSGAGTRVGGDYDLEVLPPPVSEGTISAPMVLDYNVISVTPHEGQVASAQSGSTSYSYYRLDNLTAGTSYTLSMETFPELADLYVYTSDTDLTAGTYACKKTGTSPGTPMVCNVASTGTSLWVKIGNPYVINSSRTGTYFTLHAALTP